MIKHSLIRILTIFLFLTGIFATQYWVTVEVFTETW